MHEDSSHARRREAEPLWPRENLRELTFFEAFADVHTPPQCLPPIRFRRMPPPYEQSGLYMREAFRKAIHALGLENVAPPERLTWSGAVPSPDVLRRCEKVLPNAADRIFSIAEQELELRASEQTCAFENDRGKIDMALWAGLALLAAAGVAAWFGNAYLALSLGLAGPAFALTRFLMRRR